MTVSKRSPNDAVSVGFLAQTACLLEATARKPGNVHPQARFADMTYLDFVLSAAAIAPAMNRAASVPPGETILHAIEATRRVTRANTNLGMVLLLAPLAAVPLQESLETGIADILARTTRADAEATYQAIRLAQPGGLGQADREDVGQSPTTTLTEAMTFAADRDAIARQYATAFAEVFETAGVLETCMVDRPGGVESAIVQAHLDRLARSPDTLIARKCGTELAREASARAGAALRGGSIAELDAWLRADGNRRNPGATADLVAAALFVALRRGSIPIPLTDF